MAATVGALRVTLGANTAQYEAGMRKAQVTARRTGQNISSSLKKSADDLTVSFRNLGAAAGLLGVVGFGALAKGAVDTSIRFKRIEQTMTIATGSFQKAGEELGFVRELADKLGIRFLTLAENYGQLAAAARGTNLEGEQSRKIFEEVTRAIVATGGSAEQAQGALLAVQQIISKGTVSAEELRGQLGERLPGAFQIAARAMDVSTAQLGKLLEKGAIASDDFLPKFAAQLGKELPSSVEAADAPFQRFQTTLDDISNSTADGFVKDLGAATDDLNKTLRELQSSGALEGFSNFLGDIVRMGGFVVSVIGDISTRLSELGQNLPFLARAISMALNPVGTAFGALGKATRPDRTIGTRNPDGSIDIDLDDPLPFIPRTKSGGVVSGKKKKGRAGPSAETLANRARREREQALRDAADLDRQLRDAKREELEAQLDLGGDTAERYNLQKEILDLESEQKVKDLELSVALGDMNGATQEQLQLSNDRVKALRVQLLKDQEAAQVREEVYRLDNLDLDLKQDLLETQASLARTAAERRDIELKLLDIARQKEQLEIDNLKASKEWADQEEARRRQAALNASYAAKTQATMRTTQGPWEAYLDGLPRTADDMNEALQRVKVQGVEGVIDGLVAMSQNWENMGQIARSVIQSIISDLLRLQLQKIAAGLLGNIAGSVAGGISAGTVSSLRPDVLGAMAANPGVFASGGYTGNMPAHKVAGFVHGREYVFDAEATSRIGVGNLEAMRRGLPVPANSNATFNINVTAPNTGNPRLDRQTSLQQASDIRRAVAQSARVGA